MAKAIIMCGGSGGAASDECTALKAHVLAGKKAITQDSEDEPAAGTMPERGNWNGSVGMNGSIIIPEGHHSGAGKVTGPSVTQRGAWTSRLGINGKIAIPEGYHNGSGYVDQAIATQGALTLNPGTTAKTGAVSGKYMTGNITVPAVSIPANIIKKGHRITFPDGSSVTGTFEGYVAGANELYNRGANAAGFRVGYLNSGKITFNSNSIDFYYRGAANSPAIDASNSYNFTPYSKLKITFIPMFDVKAIVAFKFGTKGSADYSPVNEKVPGIKVDISGQHEYTASIDISSLYESFVPTISVSPYNGTVRVLRIWVE